MKSKTNRISKKTVKLCLFQENTHDFDFVFFWVFVSFRLLLAKLDDNGGEIIHFVSVTDALKASFGCDNTYAAAKRVQLIWRKPQDIHERNDVAFRREVPVGAIEFTPKQSSISRGRTHTSASARAAMSSESPSPPREKGPRHALSPYRRRALCRSRQEDPAQFYGGGLRRCWWLRRRVRRGRCRTRTKCYKNTLKDAIDVLAAGHVAGDWLANEPHVPQHALDDAEGGVVHKVEFELVGKISDFADVVRVLFRVVE
jgi:hypothetical protein